MNRDDAGINHEPGDADSDFLNPNDADSRDSGYDSDAEGEEDGGEQDGGEQDGGEQDGGEQDGGENLCERRETTSGTAPVLWACLDSHTRWSCNHLFEESCDENLECVEWYDASIEIHTASCVTPGLQPCEPLEFPRCRGHFIEYCEVGGESGPDYLVSFDCWERWDENAVCEMDEDGVPICIDPNAEFCDYDTFTGFCNDDFTAVASCVQNENHEYVFRWHYCDGKCLENDFTRSWGVGAACVPSSAVESDAEPTASKVGIGCIDSLHIRYQQWGVEWVEECYVTTTGGAIDGVCYEGDPTIRCEIPGIEHCDRTTFTRYCTDDGTGYFLCGGYYSDTVTLRECNEGSSCITIDSTPMCIEPEV